MFDDTYAITLGPEGRAWRRRRRIAAGSVNPQLGGKNINEQDKSYIAQAIRSDQHVPHVHSVTRQNEPAASFQKDSWRLTDQQRDQIVAAYVDGEKGAVIAMRFGVDDSYPGKLARSRGIPRKRKATSCVCPQCGHNFEANPI